MTYVAPATVVTDEKYTAAAHNIIVEDILQFAAFNRGVFTTEAARDAAITSPTEGMHAYLTAPTVPTATGATTAIPGGVQTIYNGSVWVCVTPVGANSNTIASTTSPSYVFALTGDTVEMSATLVTGTMARVDMSALMEINTADQTHFLSFKVGGATTLAAANANSIYANLGVARSSQSRQQIITGLTAGTNTFTLAYKVDIDNTATFWTRSLIVTGIA